GQNPSGPPGRDSSKRRRPMKTATRRTMLTASAVAGILAFSTLAAPAGAAEEAKAEQVKCYAANECKGHGACGGAGHACSGQNGCKGEVVVETDSKDACLKMKGGRLTPNGETGVGGRGAGGGRPSW